jgi:hypothetical protein
MSHILNVFLFLPRLWPLTQLLPSQYPLSDLTELISYWSLVLASGGSHDSAP